MSAPGRRSTTSSSTRTAAGTSCSACPPRRVARPPRSSRSRAISTWSASANLSSPNDPAEGRIVLVRDGDWLKADGTTLGADDGVAIAAMMALAEDASLPHGPLELLMTVAEEVGLEGANAFDGSLVDRPHPGQPRQRGGREADRRVRGQHRHLDPRRRTARGPGRGRCRAGRDGERRARRPLGDEHRVRPVERGQGARPRAARGACDRPLPPRLARWAGRAATRSRATRRPSCPSRPVARPELRAAIEAVGGDDPRRVLEDRCRAST